MFKLISSFFSNFTKKMKLQNFLSFFSNFTKKKNLPNFLSFFSNLTKKKNLPNFLSFFSNLDKKKKLLIFAGLLLVIIIVISFTQKDDYKQKPTKDEKTFISPNKKQPSITSQQIEKKSESIEKLPERITKQKLTENSIKTEKLTVKKNKPNQTKQKKITSEKKETKVKKVLTLSPEQTINLLHDGLKEISNTNSNDSIKIIKLIKKTYHSQIMLKKIIGIKWNKIEKEKQNNLKNLFEEYIAKNYIKRFKKIKNPIFGIKETKKISENILVVKTDLLLGKESVSINYLLKLDQKQWKVFDVLLAGSISEIATKKSEFSSFLKSDDVDPLIEALKIKNSQLID